MTIDNVEPFRNYAETIAYPFFCLHTNFDSVKFFIHFDQHESLKSSFAKMILKIDIVELVQNYAETIAYNMWKYLHHFL